jgi:hypothetical protein
MTTSIPILRKAIGLLRIFRRDEVILQAAFIVGLISLALLIGQYAGTSDTREEKYQQVQRNGSSHVPPEPAYRDHRH